jgi:hypothetical protein
MSTANLFVGLVTRVGPQFGPFLVVRMGPTNVILNTTQAERLPCEGDCLEVHYQPIEDSRDLQAKDWRIK